MLTHILHPCPQARLGEFTTHPSDNPTIVQFAANQVHFSFRWTSPPSVFLHGLDIQVHQFSGCAELVASHARGIDLNCGCPQVITPFLLHILSKVSYNSKINFKLLFSALGSKGGNWCLPDWQARVCGWCGEIKAWVIFLHKLSFSVLHFYHVLLSRFVKQGPGFRTPISVSVLKFGFTQT